MIDIDRIVTLSERTGFPRISIFMPTHRMGAETRQDPIRLNNLLRDAAQALQARGLTPADVDRLFADARSHTGSEATDFWQHGDLGLAIYIGEDRTDYVSVPITLSEQVHVGDRFTVKPLMPMFARDAVFHVLAAAQDKVELYRAHRYGMAKMADDRLPGSAAFFTERTEPTNAVGFHSNSGGAASVQFHGLGESPKDEMQEQVANFARAVAKATDQILADGTGPLVVAADDRLLGMIRHDLHYRHTVEDGIREHPAALSEQQLHAKAYDLVRERLDAERRAAIERFRARMGAGERTAAQRLEEVVPAAVEGRIEALVVDPEAEVAGVYSAAENRAIVATGGNDNTIDLIDFAVVKTLATGGAVYALPREAPPDFPPVAATFRY